MFGHNAYGANKYGGLIKEEIISITTVGKSKIILETKIRPTVLDTFQRNKNMLYSKKRDKIIL